MTAPKIVSRPRPLESSSAMRNPYRRVQAKEMPELANLDLQNVQSFKRPIRTRQAVEVWEVVQKSITNFFHWLKDLTMHILPESSIVFNHQSQPKTRVEQLLTSSKASRSIDIGPLTKSSDTYATTMPTNPRPWGITNHIACALNTPEHWNVKQLIKESADTISHWKKSYRNSQNFVELCSQYQDLSVRLRRSLEHKGIASIFYSEVRKNDLQRILKVQEELADCVLEAAIGFVGNLTHEQDALFDSFEQSTEKAKHFDYFKIQMNSLRDRREAVRKCLQDLPVTQHLKYGTLTASLGSLQDVYELNFKRALRLMSALTANFAAEKLYDAAQAVAANPEHAQSALGYGRDLRSQTLASGLILKRDEKVIGRALADLEQTARYEMKRGPQ